MMRMYCNSSKKIEPEVVVAELRRIQDEHGIITPRQVVDEAAPKDAPLHFAFTWNNSVAAGKFRVWEARTLIRSVEVQVDEGPREPVFAHVVTDTDEDGDNEGSGGYMTITAIAKDDVLTRSAIDGLAKKLDAQIRSLDMICNQLGRSSGVGRKLGRAKRKLTEAKELVSSV